MTESRPELDEQEQKELDARLRYLADNLDKRPVVKIKYFIPDERKSGGAIAEFNGIIHKITNGFIFTADGGTVCLENIIALDIPERAEI